MATGTTERIMPHANLDKFDIRGGQARVLIQTRTWSRLHTVCVSRVGIAVQKR